MRILVAVALLLTVAGCHKARGPVIGSPPPGSIIVVPSFEWHVVDSETMRLLFEKSGEPVVDGRRHHGIVGTSMDGKRVVVVTLPPVRVDDDATLTLGHEVLHIALGEYHKEPEG